VSIITLVFVSQVSLCSFHHKDEYHFDSTVQIRRNLTRNVFMNRVYRTDTERVQNENGNKCGTTIEGVLSGVPC